MHSHELSLFFDKMIQFSVFVN